MSYYYFLARPRTDVSTTLTITQFVPNALGKKLRTTPFDIAVYSLDRGDNWWLLRDDLSFGNSQHVTVSSDQLGLDNGEIAVVVPVPAGFSPATRTRELPAATTRTVGGSPVAARGSLRFHWSGISSSYQSEYPAVMAERTTGSINSFNLSALPQGRNATVLFCAVNITRDASHSSRDYSILPISQDGIPLRHATATAQRNGCTVIEMNSVEAASRLAYSSRDAVFLPIYVTLSTSPQGPEMSVEHTHPPHEMFWLRSSQAYCVPRLRDSWLRA